MSPRGQKHIAAEAEPCTTRSKVAKTDAPANGKAAAKSAKRGSKASLGAAVFKAKALLTHVNLTHTPPVLAEDAKNVHGQLWLESVTFELENETEEKEKLQVMMTCVQRDCHWQQKRCPAARCCTVFEDQAEVATRRLRALDDPEHNDFVIALGGGKMIDTAKCVTDLLQPPVAVLPTTTSTDAPFAFGAVAQLILNGADFAELDRYIEARAILVPLPPSLARKTYCRDTWKAEHPDCQEDLAAFEAYWKGLTEGEKRTFNNLAAKAKHQLNRTAASTA
ncbi:uncharacterized protein PHACADRAFT_194934 [Phanerochaete carnosa HHB-10118-sp]|uniref:Alcohol dehydrogenase iron-type/glycerol dehydrogenase GldA domain-containing protein n=1 Tax=Phanerochaete carnosa (strain HHB-10118-sp) TaxID=650164 RepID=K5V474_PHACS|nr:uncharacterized protein PHACADRAFT_194934 [Phanerochaete carnosa HHB-10118-sp]EKM57386.1 hypothetical protein PHACADRAFT_194934 [Phanerochaete carnosa HHB-10118-sp]